MPSLEEERNERAAAVSNATTLLMLLQQQLHLRVGLRVNLGQYPLADTTLAQLDHAIEQLGKFSTHPPHSHEATRILVDGFQVALATLEWLDHAPLSHEPSASHKMAELPAEPVGALTEQSSADLRLDQREVLKREISRIQQNLVASEYPQTPHIEPVEHTERPPIKTQEEQSPPQSPDSEKPR
jgi:hypothetical protein